VRVAIPVTPSALAPAEPSFPPPRKEPHDNPGEAAAFFKLQRTGDITGEYPVEKIMEGMRRAERMDYVEVATKRKLGRGKQGAQTFAQTQVDLGKWESLGPGNVGGRTRSLLIDPKNPDTMYAGAVGGGVWKTTDAGRSWLPIADLLPSIGISAMAMDPKDSNVIYAATGEWFTGDTRGNSIRGAGVFKSTDGGATWQHLTATNNSRFYYTNKIVVSPNDSSRLYAATFGGVWRSLDSGETWDLVLNRTTPNTGCQDLVIRTDQTSDFLLAACGTTTNSPTAIFRNTAAETSAAWEEAFKAENMARTSLALAPSNQNIIYAMSASLETGNYRSGLLGIYRSNDGGAPGSWTARVTNKDSNRLNTTQLSNPREMFRDTCFGLEAVYLNQGGYDNVIAVDPANPEIVWTGGIDLMRSDDGGQNWGIASFWDGAAPQMSHADHHVIMFHPNYDGAGNQIIFNANDGGVYRADNARAPIATGPRAACRPYNTQVRWASLNNGYAATQFYKGASYPGSAAYMGGTQDNGTLRGSNATGPNRWQTIRGGDGGFTALDRTDPNIVFNTYVNLSINRSLNGGSTQSAAISGITEASNAFLFIAPFTLDPSDQKRLYTGGRALWRTTNSAASWTQAARAFPIANGQISAIAVAPSDPKTVVYATSQGFIYRSKDALNTNADSEWEVSRPRPGFVSQVVFDPVDPEIVYATYSQFKRAGQNDSHVYKSTDGGATWTGIDGEGDNAIPDIPVFDLLPDPNQPSTLYLGTDLGLFVSYDGGGSWARDLNPFAHSPVTTLSMERGAGVTHLFAFTMGRGVFRTTLPDSGKPCEYKVGAVSGAFHAIGETKPLELETSDGCEWTIVPLSSSTGAVGSPALGKGKGSTRISIPLNTTTVARSAQLLIQNQVVTVNQGVGDFPTGNDAVSTPYRIASVPFVSVQDTRALTAAAGDPVHSCTSNAGDRTLWYRFTATRTGPLELGFQMSGYARFGDIGAVLSMYPDTGSGPGEEIACTFVPPSTQVITTRRIRPNVTQGVTYLIQISASGATPVGGYLVFFAQYLQ
jgi:photosystem II stability/assembly factor-like uncharacterized protein